MTTMQKIYSEESFGTYGGFKIEINVGATKLPDIQLDAIKTASYDASKSIKSAVMGAVVAANEESQRQRVAEREQIVSLFKEPIYVEEIPNGYCPDWCCKHLPWFVITTRVGRFQVGWRKRVMSVDWSGTTVTKTSEELFPSENVTKDKRLIHAWSVEDAARYISTVIGSANP